MNQNNKISSITSAAVFLIVVVLLGTVSLVKLLNFYINDEVDYNEWSANLGSKLETDIATSFYEKFQFVNMNGALKNLLEQQEMNGVIKLNNGYLLTTIGYTSDAALQTYADKVTELNNYLDNNGIPLLYAATPYTSGKYDPQIPTGIDDYGNDNIDRFLEMLKENGVDTMDFRELMYEDGIDHYDMMYRTDHHWTTKAGFYAYGKLAEYLQDELDCEIDERIGNMDNYTVTTYAKWHLGSRGQRTGIYYAGIDDFDLIIPNFETIIQCNDETGTLQELFINMEPLQVKDYTSRYTYDHVLDRSLAGGMNLNSLNDKKLLIVSDSFAKAVNPYLIMAFGEVRFIYDGNSSSLTKDYIDSYQPDAVVLLYYSNLLSEGSSAFNFQGF